MPATVEKRSAGRPPILPEGTKNRTIRMTTSEWESVKNFLKRIRCKKPTNQGK